MRTKISFEEYVVCFFGGGVLTGNLGFWWALGGGATAVLLVYLTSRKR